MDAISLMIEVISDNSPDSIWTGAPLESFRRVHNTNRGDIGEEFLARYLERSGVPIHRSESRVAPWDIEIRGRKLEVKTASEDTSGLFQFNHVRLDRAYDYLFCLGVRPSEILFQSWRKGQVAEGSAGTLVRMAEGQSVTFKLTKKPDEMLLIDNLLSWIDTHFRT